MPLTQEQLDNAAIDVQYITDVATGPEGATVAKRTGGSTKTVDSVIGEMQDKVDAQTVQEQEATEQAELAAAAAAAAIEANNEAQLTAGSTAITVPTERPAFAAGDGAGNDVIQVWEDFIRHRHMQRHDNDIAALRADATTRRVRRSRLMCGVCHLIVYGQSNAVASHGRTQVPGGSATAGALITGDVVNALTFNVGELTGAVTTPGTQLATLIPLNNANMVGGSREGWGAASALMIKQLLQAEDSVTAADLSHRWLVSSMGESATAIEQLMEGTSTFARVIRDIEYGALRAADQTGAMQVYQPRNLLMVEGESDYQIGGGVTPFEQYIQKSAQLAKDISGYAADSSGITDDVIQWVIQVASHISYASVTTPTIAMAQLEMERRGICMPIIPGYGALGVNGMDTDQVHYIAPGLVKLAATLGWQMKRLLYDGVIEKGCRVVSYEQQGVWTLLEFSGYGPLVLDTTSLPAWANHGIQAVNGAGAAITVSSVNLVDAPHRILAVKTASPPAALRFGWAGSTVTARNQTGGTNIRDSLRDILTFTRPDSVVVPIDNHLPIMELVL